MSVCSKCENLYVDFRDVLDHHVDTFHPDLDTMAAVRRPEVRFLVTMECPVCRDRAMAGRDEKLMDAAGPHPGEARREDCGQGEHHLELSDVRHPGGE